MLNTTTPQKIWDNKNKIQIFFLKEDGVFVTIKVGSEI